MAPLDVSATEKHVWLAFTPAALPGANMESFRTQTSTVPTITSRFNARRFAPIHPLRFANCRSATKVKCVMGETSGVIQNASAAIHVSFEKALKELRRPDGPATPFVNCRQIVAAILVSKGTLISASQFLDEVLRYQHTNENCSLPMLSMRQREIVPAFVKLVYSVDTFFALTPRQRMKLPQQFRSEQFHNLLRLQSRLRQGRSVALMAMEEYLMDIFNSCNELEVASRRTLPRRWTNIISSLVLELKDSVDSS